MAHLQWKAFSCVALQTAALTTVFVDKISTNGGIHNDVTMYLMHLLFQY